MPGQSRNSTHTCARGKGAGGKDYAAPSRAGRLSGYSDGVGAAIFSLLIGRSVRQSRADRGRACRADQGGSLGGQDWERYWEAELYRLKGYLTLQQGKLQDPRSYDAETEAEVYFQKAIEIAQRQR